MSTQKYYLVIVNYQTSQNGNDGTARIRVKADNEAQAIELATKKASSYTRVGKVVGGHVDGSPAPGETPKHYQLTHWVLILVTFFGGPIGYAIIQIIKWVAG
jgi:hypothetical protein